LSYVFDRLNVSLKIAMKTDAKEFYLEATATNYVLEVEAAVGDNLIYIKDSLNTHNRE
jgi:hypothetical protein